MRDRSISSSTGELATRVATLTKTDAGSHSPDAFRLDFSKLAKPVYGAAYSTMQL